MFCMKRNQRKEWEFLMAAIRTLFNILGFILTFLIFYKMYLNGGM